MPTTLSTLRRLLAVLLAVVLVASACGDDAPSADADGDAPADAGDDAASPDAAPSADADGDAPADAGADADAAGGDAGADAAASDGDDATAEPTGDPSPSPTPVPVDNTDLAVKPVVQVPEGAPPTDLVVDDIVEGSGPVAEAGDFAIMQYVGVTFDDGAQFDASWDRGSPFTFTLGQGEVIAGWDEGIAGMAPGGRRELVIPPDMAYGESGSGSGAIGPNETLIFIVDLLGLVPADLTKPEVGVPEEEATELAITDLVDGTGAEATADSLVWIHYVGKNRSTAEQFDATWDRGPQAVPIRLGAGQLIEGLEQGLVGMKVGGRRELVIPPELAFGETGAGEGRIPPDETLVFVVDLIAVT